jgi:hypothetical protein
MVRKLFITLSLTAATIFSLHAATLRGVVEDNARNPNPVAGAVVRFTSTGAGTVTEYRDTTGTDGQYRITISENGTYDITVTKTGFTPDPQNDASVTIRSSTGTVVIDLVMAPKSSGATVSGTMTDSLTNAYLIGAKLFLQQSTMGTWRAIDSAISGNSGAYTFDSVASGTYRIQASLNGYASKTSANLTVSGTQAQTVNIALVVVQTGKITGKVTGDSANGAAISGARVILEKVSGAVIAIDTATTDANGGYLFSTVEAGPNYDLTVSKTGYIEKTVRHSRQTAGIDTVNVALLKIQTGSLYVKVLKQTDSTAIVGADVSITPTSGAMVTQTVGANGMAVFADQPTGTYAIIISAAGFLMANRTGYRIETNAKDTLVYFMAVSTGGTKTLVGLVSDSSSKAGIAKVRVSLSLQSGGGTYTLVDSTDATGHFIISGIPLSATTGTVLATCSGYRNNSNTHTMGKPNQADTAELSIFMVRVPTEIFPQAALCNTPGKPEIRVAGARIMLRNFNENGVATVFTMNGKVVFQTMLASRLTTFVLPANITGGMYVVSVAQKNAVYRQQVILP